MTKCGFLSGSFIADPDSIGLIVGGTTPFGPDIFFVRKALQIGASEPEALICRVYAKGDGGIYEVETYPNGPNERPASEKSQLAFLSLALGASVPVGTFIIAHRNVLEALSVEDL